LFLLTRVVADLVSYCDAISPFHLAMFGWGAVVLTGLARLKPVPRGLLFGGFVLTGGGALGIAFAVAPQRRNARAEDLRILIRLLPNIGTRRYSKGCPFGVNPSPTLCNMRLRR
jgi:pimeloyl-ACP methyl ester carboxylesterase